MVVVGKGAVVLWQKVVVLSRWCGSLASVIVAGFGGLAAAFEGDLVSLYIIMLEL